MNYYNMRILCHYERNDEYDREGDQRLRERQLQLQAEERPQVEVASACSMTLLTFLFIKTHYKTTKAN